MGSFGVRYVQNFKGVRPSLVTQPQYDSYACRESDPKRQRVRMLHKIWNSSRFGAPALGASCWLLASGFIELHQPSFRGIVLPAVLRGEFGDRMQLLAAVFGDGHYDQLRFHVLGAAEVAIGADADPMSCAGAEAGNQRAELRHLARIEGDDGVIAEAASDEAVLIGMPSHGGTQSSDNRAFFGGHRTITDLPTVGRQNLFAVRRPSDALHSSDELNERITEFSALHVHRPSRRIRRAQSNQLSIGGPAHAVGTKFHG